MCVCKRVRLCLEGPGQELWIRNWEHSWKASLSLCQEKTFHMVANFSNYLRVKWLPDDNNRKSTLTRQYYCFDVYSFKTSVVTLWDQNLIRTALNAFAWDPLSVATSGLWTVMCFLLFVILALINLQHQNLENLESWIMRHLHLLWRCFSCLKIRHGRSSGAASVCCKHKGMSVCWK